MPDIQVAFNTAITHERQQACGTNVSQIMLAQGMHVPGVTSVPI